MIWFTADEHYGHANIIRYCDRPFATVEEMNEEIIRRHNEVVQEGDVVYHLGDFTFGKPEQYSNRLRGRHVFLQGNHDRKNLHHPQILRLKWEDTCGERQVIVMCHYAMRVWDKSHFNSWQLFGHSHGTLEEVGKQLDVGVDTHDFYPYSIEEVAEIMETKDDNPNYFMNLPGVKKGLVDDLIEEETGSE